ncbi:cold shock domain-containing protein [Streptomyces sp. NBC_00005]|uniref:cold shock domain-containing protein n=1 Tax=Streptomyces sp. NBC_00005 TaxID=2903609 RepID=UPI00386850AD
MAESFFKWFNSEKGYGYLTVEAYADHDIGVGNQGVFVHYSEIEISGYRTLDEGE